LGASDVNAEFIGWNTAADGSGASYAGGSQCTVKEQNTVFYAQWETNPNPAPVVTPVVGMADAVTQAGSNGVTVITASGTWNNATAITADLMLVGGGGGGSGAHTDYPPCNGGGDNGGGGGGGGGGIVLAKGISLPAGAYHIVIGQGGYRGDNETNLYGSPGQSGTDTTITFPNGTALKALGGGGGGAGSKGLDGGSGGGDGAKRDNGYDGGKALYWNGTSNVPIPYHLKWDGYNTTVNGVPVIIYGNSAVDNGAMWGGGGAGAASYNCLSGSLAGGGGGAGLVSDIMGFNYSFGAGGDSSGHSSGYDGKVTPADPTNYGEGGHAANLGWSSGDGASGAPGVVVIKPNP
jgi:hypothetical protein